MTSEAVETMDLEDEEIEVEVTVDELAEGAEPVAEDLSVAADVEAAVKEEEEPLSQSERDWVEEIREAEAACAEAEEEAERAAKDAKAAKKAWEVKVEILRSLVRNGPSKQPSLPGMDAPTEDPFAEPAPEGEEDLVIPAPDYNAWLALPITDAIKLTEKQREKLEAARVKTIGDFEHLRAGKDPSYPDGLLSLDRVGETTVDKWEDEIVEHLDKYKKSIGK